MQGKIQADKFNEKFTKMYWSIDDYWQGTCIEWSEQIEWQKMKCCGMKQWWFSVDRQTDKQPDVFCSWVCSFGQWLHTSSPPLYLSIHSCCWMTDTGPLLTLIWSWMTPIIQAQSELGFNPTKTATRTASGSVWASHRIGFSHREPIFKAAFLKLTRVIKKLYFGVLNYSFYSETAFVF